MVNSPRAGGKYFITGTAAEVLKNHDDPVRTRLTSWLVEQRRLGNPCPEIHTGTISEARQRKDLGIPERADGILKYLATRSNILGDRIRYRVFLDLYDESVPTEHEREYFGLLSHSESINKNDLSFLLDYLDQCGLVENTALDGGMGGCVLTAKSYMRLEAVDRPHGEAVQPLNQPLQTPSVEDFSNGKWDVFISHASEDKEDFVRPLAEGLSACGLRVWYDEFSLKVGDRLRESIDHGLGQSRFGVVVLSQHFFSKRWPQNELDGLVTRETSGSDVILPVWHNITREQVEEFSPTLADRFAARSEQGLDHVIEDLLQVIDTTASESKAAAPTSTLNDWMRRESNWRRQSRSGREAAELIMTAPTFDDARRVHDAFTNTDGRSHTSYAHFAFFYRTNMEKEDTVMYEMDRVINDTEDDIDLDMDSDEAKALIALYEDRKSMGPE